MIGAVLKTALIVMFIAGAASIRFARSEEQKRRRVTMLMLFVIAVQLAVGITQHDAWPFATYRWLYGRAVPDTVDMRNTVVAVGRDGRESRLPDAAFAPLSSYVLNIWMTHGWPQLGAKEQRQALVFLDGLLRRRGAQDDYAGLRVIMEYRSISTRDDWHRGRAVAEYRP